MSEINTNKEKDIQINIEDTSIKEYLDIVRKEYETERSKRQSFENRSGIIITILAALCIFVFDKIKLLDIIASMTKPINFLLLIKITSGILVYSGFVISMILIIKTINIKQFTNLKVEEINEKYYLKKPVESMSELIKIYAQIICQHREVNNNNAICLKRAFYSVAITVFAVVIYINI